jgi:hypothetical protein
MQRAHGFGGNALRLVRVAALGTRAGVSLGRSQEGLRITPSRRRMVSAGSVPFSLRLDAQAAFAGAQCQGMSSSMRFSIQPFTRRVSASLKYRCGLTSFSLYVSTSPAMQAHPAALRALLLQAWRERDGIAAERGHAARERDHVAHERDDALAQNERLLALLAKLQRMQFGRKSERLPEDQLHFAFEEIGATLAANEAAAEKTSPQRRANGTEQRRKARGKLPAHLPRVEVVIEPAESTCPCCRGTMAVIGADSSDRLDVIPAQYQMDTSGNPLVTLTAG